MKKNTRIVDPGKREQLLFAGDSCTQRNTEAGLDLKPIGALNAAKKVGQSCPVLVFNSSNVVAYISFGDASVTAPTGAANGIPVLPNEKFIVNSGKATHIIASNANVFGYTGDNYEA